MSLKFLAALAFNGVIYSSSGIANEVSFNSTRRSAAARFQTETNFRHFRHFRHFRPKYIYPLALRSTSNTYEEMNSIFPFV